MADNQVSRRCLLCRILYSALGVVIGLSAFLLWLTAFDHSEATIHTLVFSGLSCVLAAWNMVAHIMHLQDYWRTWLRGLRCFIAFGAVFMVVAFAGFVTYLTLGITEKQALDVGSYYITCVWCFISFKWATLLLYHSISYRNEFSDLTALLEF